MRTVKNQKKTSFILSNLLVLLAAVILVGASTSVITVDSIATITVGTTTVSISPASQTVNPSDIFDVDVYCDPGQPIRAYQFSLSFNPSLIQCDSVTEGNIFSGYSSYFGYVSIDNVAGDVKFVYNAIMGAGNITGSGTFAIISFTAQSGSGTSTLDLHTVKVEDEVGPVPISVNDGSVTVTGGNVPPTATIESISPSPANEGESVAFSGTGSDTDGTVVAWEWSSSIDDVFGSAEDVSYSGLSVGTHTISFRVKDNDNAWSTADTASLTINPNNPPTAHIDSITPNPADEGVSVTFNGHGTDPDTGDTITGYNWRSSIDGQLSTSASFSDSTLSVGTHTIYFKVKDNHNEWSTEDSDTLVINETNNPPRTPSIDGPTSGKKGTEYPYDVRSTDPDGDEIKYVIDWGDDTIDTMGFYSSGVTVTVKHTWSEKGTYTIKVKAVDEHDAESDWATLSVSMPRNKPYFNAPFLQFMQNFLQQHPNLFPILQRLLHRL